MADLGPSRAGQDQKRSPAESGARHHARRFVRTTLGDRGDVGGRPARLTPHLVVSVPWFKPPQASHKTQTRSCCSLCLGIGWEGEGARGGPTTLRAPLVFRGRRGRGTTLASALANGWPRHSAQRAHGGDGPTVFAHAKRGPRGHRVEAEELALPLGPLAGLAQVEEPGVRGGEAGGRRGLGQRTMAINYRSHFAYRIDAWDADGENVIEHLAGVEDLQVAMATYLAACQRWPGTPITLRQGTRVIEDSRRNCGVRECRLARLPPRRMNSRRSHSITSSARASSVGGTSRPSTRAVWRLMTSSNLLACTTGRSVGLAPLRMRPA